MGAEGIEDSSLEEGGVGFVMQGWDEVLAEDQHGTVVVNASSSWLQLKPVHLYSIPVYVLKPVDVVGWDNVVCIVHINVNAWLNRMIKHLYHEVGPIQQRDPFLLLFQKPQIKVRWVSFEASLHLSALEVFYQTRLAWTIVYGVDLQLDSAAVVSFAVETHMDGHGKAIQSRVNHNNGGVSLEGAQIIWDRGYLIVSLELEDYVDDQENQGENLYHDWLNGDPV